MKEEKQLTDKQKVFVSEYVKDFNATQSAIRAGYSESTAGSIGGENLQKPEIKREINLLLSEIISNNKDTAVKVIRECHKIAFAKMTDFVDYTDSELTLKSSEEVDSSALESISFDTTYSGSGEYTNTTTKKKIKLHDKLKALEILSKYTGLYKDTPDLNVTNIIYMDQQDENL